MSPEEASAAIARILNIAAEREARRDADRAKAATNLRQAARIVLQWLRSERWGNHDYMNGTDVFIDAEQNASMLSQAINEAERHQ